MRKYWWWEVPKNPNHFFSLEISHFLLSTHSSIYPKNHACILEIFTPNIIIGMTNTRIRTYITVYNDYIIISTRHCKKNSENIILPCHTITKNNSFLHISFTFKRCTYNPPHSHKTHLSHRVFCNSEGEWDGACMRKKGWRQKYTDIIFSYIFFHPRAYWIIIHLYSHKNIFWMDSSQF